MRRLGFGTTLVAASAVLACPGPRKEVVYDLAARLPVAERWSQREVVLFGTPSAEPHQAEGFYREAGGSDGDPFLWARGEAEVSLDWSGIAPRVAVLEVAPYRGVKSQSADVRLNGRTVTRLNLNDARYRYRIPLPPEAQKTGDNRLRFVFAATASPSAANPADPDRRELSAAFYSLVIGVEGDPSIEDLLGRDAPAPYSVASEGGVPTLVQAGGSVIRYAVRLPARAELRFTPALHPLARAAATPVWIRVTLEAHSGDEHPLWSRTLDPAAPSPEEVAVDLPGRAGDIVRIGLVVGGAPQSRFVWGTWKAPRILGRGPADPLDTGARPADDGRADGLRRALAGSNVMLVILDAARAQEFGCYGYGRSTTPEIDRIAAEGIIFERAFTPAVYTLGAMSSVWTSQHPDRHHSEVSYSARLPKDRLTLAELLSAHGVVSAGFVANAVAGVGFGFDRGFSEFHEPFKEKGTGGGMFRDIVPPWLRAHKDRPFFAYVHFREPHFPYDPDPPFDTRFGPDGPIPKPMRREMAWITEINQERRKAPPEEVDHVVRLYDGNLAFADQEVGRIQRALQDEGLLDRTVLIVAADHGEGLYEHGWIGHNVELYETSVHVPLIVRLPAGKGPAGLRVRGLVDLLDLAPTIAEIFGLRGQGGSDREFQGRSLLDAVLGAPGKPAVLSRTVWDRPRYAIRDERFKFFYDTRTGEQHLYDLEQDPGEVHDRIGIEPLRAAYYQQALHHWIARLGRRRAPGGEEARLTPEQCENLKALGYVGAGCPQ
jgi:arylsulfatase